MHQTFSFILSTFVCCRLSDCDTSLNGSYRQNSEFLKADDKNIANDNEKQSNQSQFLTWDTLKKIRRQKSCKLTSELKKYQSSVCLVDKRSIKISQCDTYDSNFASLDTYQKYSDRSESKYYYEA